MLIFSGCNKKARNHGGARGCNVPTTNLDTANRNLQNIKDKRANHATKNVRHHMESTFCLC
jgi:hypothetical protein